MDLKKLLGKSVSELKSSNKIAIAALIERFGPITILELSQRSSLSRATVSNMLEELISEGLVKNTKKDKSTGGRRPDKYSIISNNHYILGLSLGRYKINVLLTDLKSTVIEYRNLKIEGNDIEKDIIPQAFEAISNLLNKEIKTKIIGVGISFPGTINNQTGEIYDSPNIGGEGINLKKIFYKYFNLPVYVENDANSVALAEWWFGAAKNKESILYIYAGRGTGCGILINGEVYRGSNKLAADVGHSIIDINGEKCHCGSYGCVETYTSYRAIIKRFMKSVKIGAYTELNIDDFCKLNEYEIINKIIDSAIKGDQLSIDIISETGRILGIACANLLNLFDPEKVIIGGNLIKAGDILFEPFVNLALSRSKKIIREKVKIEKSNLGPMASAFGGVAVVLENFFQTII
jgi:N-acetylglucosamine repressor